VREVVVTIEAPPDVSIRVVRKEAPSRLRVSPRGKVGKPVETFMAAFSTSSRDGGATAPADAVRDHFVTSYPATGKNRKETVWRAWRRALALVEGAFEVVRREGEEILVKLPASPSLQTTPPVSSGKTGEVVPSISATRGARTPRSG